MNWKTVFHKFKGCVKPNLKFISKTSLDVGERGIFHWCKGKRESWGGGNFPLVQGQGGKYERRLEKATPKKNIGKQEIIKRNLDEGKCGGGKGYKYKWGEGYPKNGGKG